VPRQSERDLSENRQRRSHAGRSRALQDYVKWRRGLRIRAESRRRRQLVTAPLSFSFAMKMRIRPSHQSPCSARGYWALAAAFSPDRRKRSAPSVLELPCGPARGIEVHAEDSPQPSGHRIGATISVRPAGQRHVAACGTRSTAWQAFPAGRAVDRLRSIQAAQSGSARCRVCPPSESGPQNCRSDSGRPRRPDSLPVPVVDRSAPAVQPLTSKGTW